MKNAVDIRVVLVFAGIIAALFAKGLVAELPPVRADNPPGVFDAVRAKERLARILGDERPHPVDSEANDAVRARLLAEIEALGYEPEVRDDFACNARFARIACARVQNVLFRAGPDVDPDAGPDAGKATMIASHYDSVPAGPGAGDDGIGIAASLEIAALLAQAPPTRPVLFLITDGEETGLIGARSFVEVDPLKDRVERVINLEARGVRGPAQMFQTAEPNGTDVAIFAAGAARPVSNSMMTDVYRLLPNDTDLTEFLPLGYGALNIALTAGVEFYHTPGDNLDALDARSLQHMGDLALGSLDASLQRGEAAGGGQVIFTDILSRWFVVLPQWLGAAILILGLALSLLAFARAGGTAPLRALLAAPAGLFLAGGIAFGLQYAIGLLRPGAFYWSAHPEGAQGLSYLSAALGVLLGAALLARGTSGRRLAAANWGWFAAVGLAAYAVAPGASILFALPVAVFAIGALAGLLAPAAERLFALLAAILALIVLAPALYLAEIGLGFAIMAVPALVAALLFMVWTAPAMGGGETRIGRLPLAIGAAGLIAAAAATLLAPAYSPEKPRPLSLQYYVDAEAREAKWLIASTGEPAPEEMSKVAAFAQAEIEALGAERLAAPAPYLETEPPRLEVVDNHPTAEGRMVRIRLAAGGADQLALLLPEEAGATGIVVAGRTTAFSGDGARSLVCTGRSCDGAEFEIALGADPVEARLIGVQYGLPFAAAALVSARPDWATPIQNGDVSIVAARASL